MERRRCFVELDCGKVINLDYVVTVCSSEIGGLTRDTYPGRLEMRDSPNLVTYITRGDLDRITQAMKEVGVFYSRPGEDNLEPKQCQKKKETTT